MPWLLVILGILFIFLGGAGAVNNPVAGAVLAFGGIVMVAAGAALYHGEDY